MRLRVGVVGIKGIPAKGGSERVVEEIVRRLRHDIDFTIYSMDDYVPESYQRQGVRIVRIKVPEGRLLKPVVYQLKAAFLAIRDGKHDIIHVHNSEVGFLLPILRLRYHAIISTAHGPGYDRVDKWNAFELMLLRLIEWPFIKLCRIATAVNRPLSEYYARRYAVDSRFIPNGVDKDPEVDLNWMPECLRSPGGDIRKYILFLTGRMLPTKGVDKLLEALAIAKPEIPTMIVGGMGYIEEYDNKILKMVSELENVYYHPLIAEKSRVLGLMKNCHLFVFPSSVEAMSMVLLEVASLGTPVVCSDIRENVDVMGDNAVYFKVDDGQDLASKLCDALNNAESLSERAKTYKDQLIQNQNWDSIARQYKRLYEELAEGH